jgi:predicted metal-dependent enzyme (double-stranded beta helix superfamily)
MFDLDRFLADCRDAVADDPTHLATREVVRRAMAAPDALVAALGEPREAGLTTLYRAPDLTVLHVVWGPWMTLKPHNHLLWAVIGVYGGAEDNVFWRRIPTEAGGRIEAAGARALRTGDVCALGADVIHSVTNPTSRLTGAIHVYGGDFFRDDRAEWDPETLREQPLDIEHTRRMFADSNSRLARS